MPSSTVTAVARGSGKHRGSLSQSGRRPQSSPANSEKNAPWNVDESRSVRSAWIWRGFLMMSILAIGISLVLFGNGHRYQTMAELWLVIAVGWFAISMWLWRKHSQYMKS